MSRSPARHATSQKMFHTGEIKRRVLRDVAFSGAEVALCRSEVARGVVIGHERLPAWPIGTETHSRSDPDLAEW